MSDSVRDYLARCRDDEGHRKVLKEAHKHVEDHGKGKGFDKRNALAPILAHAKKLGFHFTEDELIHFVTGKG